MACDVIWWNEVRGSNQHKGSITKAAVARGSIRGVFFSSKKKKKILNSALFLPNYFSSLILSINITLNHIIIMIANFLINKILIGKV